MDSRVEIRAALERGRAETTALLAPIFDEEVASDAGAARSKLAWELARIVRFEEHWLVRTLAGEAPPREAHADVHEAFERERNEDDTLPPLGAERVQAYADDVRERALRRLEDVDLDTPNPLLRNGFVFGLVLQHELEHQEAMLETLAQSESADYPLTDAPAPDRAPVGPAEVRIDGGSFILGATDEPWAYDNELVPHEVELQPFSIDRAPVTNGDLAQFAADKGYRSEKHWSPAGWQWRERHHVSAPLHWRQSGDGWERIRFGRRERLPLDEPVQHVSWYEADAFARWAGKRLPTEPEWERAAAWDEHRGRSRFPWGREFVGYEANLGRQRFSPAPAGSYAGGVSPAGCVQLSGDVWEWTSSHFLPYPGFLSFPYPEQSEIYFGEEYYVLRGGSWAADPLLARSSFRRWEYPWARHHFAGFRCARDA